MKHIDTVKIDMIYQSHTKKVTVGIKTFLRTDQLVRCLDSLVKHDWYEVIVVDDGPIDNRRKKVFEEYSRKLPLRIIYLDFDTGLAAGRNVIVKECRTDYLLIIDDDHTVPENIYILKMIIDDKPEIGGVSCIWRENGRRHCGACDIIINGKTLIKQVYYKLKVQTTQSGYKYILFDFIPNSTLFRMDCLKDIKWDPFYKIGREHIDFYLSHKRFGKWKFAVALDVEIGHHPGQSSSEYLKYRKGKRVEVSNEYFMKKFGLDRVKEGSKYINMRYSLKEMVSKRVTCLFQNGK